MHRTQNWWNKFITVEMAIGMLSAAAFTGGVYMSLTKDVEAADEKVEGVVIQVEEVKKQLSQVGNTVELIKQKQTDLSDKTAEIERKMDRRAEILDAKLDSINRLIIERNRNE